MLFFEMNVCQFMAFRTDNVYNKHGRIKFGNETREKLQVSSHVRE